MRTWILCGCLLIANTINPTYEIPPAIAIITITLLVGGFFLDILEVIRLLIKK
jgi:hypothetical protein